MTKLMQSAKTLEDLPRKLLRYAELLASGQKTVRQAALECGYSKSMADSRSYRWIAKTRETSLYPALYDYYEKLRIEKLRLHDITVDSITSELKIIAFSSIENYLDLPSKAVHDKINRLRKQSDKLYKRLDELRIKEEADDSFLEATYAWQGKQTKPKYKAEAKPILAQLEKVGGQISELEKGPGFKIALKFKEEIPKELMPAIAEIRETRDGLVVKLHNKLESIDMLARWQKMYANPHDKGMEDNPLSEVKEINLVVQGSKSTLMTITPKGAAPGDPENSEKVA